MNKNKLKPWVRLVVLGCAIGLALVIVLPIWKIELSAPQYPEGLELQIFAGKLGGNVEVVNGLNHYIGMKTLHENDFIEFTVLPYIIGFFIALSAVVVIINRKKWLYALTSLFILFAVLAMVDFWKWEYDYGHNLNPNAPIQVPGMTYQPPLIGFKQLLNFGAYSIPDIGGWIFIAVGVLLFVVSIVEIRSNKGTKNNSIRSKSLTAATSIILMFLISSCNAEPTPIKVGQDACHFCKMTISDNRFGAEILTKKGKTYKFDDAHCFLSFYKSNEVKQADIRDIYFVDFGASHQLIKGANAQFLKSSELRSPMNGNIAAFSSAKDLQQALQQYKGEKITYEDVVK